MKNEKPYVRIHSNVTIQVTPGLQNQDVSNPDAHVPDRLKISPTWPTAIVMIKQGPGVYPSEIAEWPTVRALAKDGILTIGEYISEPSEDAEKAKTKILESGLTEKKEVKESKEEKKELKLADIAGDEE